MTGVQRAVLVADGRVGDVPAHALQLPRFDGHAQGHGQRHAQEHRAGRDHREAVADRRAEFHLRLHEPVKEPRTTTQE